MKKLGKNSILHIEDDPVIQALVNEEFIFNGFNVFSALDVSTALDVLTKAKNEEESFKMIIMDIDMGGKENCMPILSHCIQLKIDSVIILHSSLPEEVIIDLESKNAFNLNIHHVKKKSKVITEEKSVYMVVEWCFNYMGKKFAPKIYGHQSKNMRELNMEVAEKLLVNGTSLNNTRELLGYSTNGSFSRAYKGVHGIRPPIESRVE